MVRSPCCSKVGLNKGTWTALEDNILTSYIKAHGEGQWRNLPNKAGLKRCGKSCRLRWLNYLRPDIKRGNITTDEEELILRLHRLLGNRWSLIAGRLPGRTDNEIKNYWHTILSKKANPPSLQGNYKAAAMTMTTEVVKPFPTKPRRPPPLRENFDDLRHNEVNPINSTDLELPVFQCDDHVRGTAAYYSGDLGFFDFENHGDDLFPACNILSMEDFFMEECMGNGNNGREDQKINNSLDMESLDMFSSTKQWT